jgi:hypothetical protein
MRYVKGKISHAEEGWRRSTLHQWPGAVPQAGVLPGSMPKGVVFIVGMILFL